MSVQTIPPVGILVSSEVARIAGEQIQKAFRQTGVQSQLIVLSPQDKLSGERIQAIHCALMSVDLIGNSSKHALDPYFQNFIDTLMQAPQLEWLQVCSAGMDRAFFATLFKRGVKLTSGAGSNSRAVAQTAITGILAISRKVPQWIEQQKEKKWVPIRGALTPVALEGQQAVIIGMGEIGQQIARILSAMDVRVIGVRRTPGNTPYFQEEVGNEELDRVIGLADWLIIACPLTERTHHLINALRLSKMKPEAVIVNIARGDVIDEQALIYALNHKQIAGAYLDVFSMEPLSPDSPLWAMPQVLVSPHFAGNSTAHQRNIIHLFIENIPKFAIKERMKNEWSGP